jgi:hypothetical protein
LYGPVFGFGHDICVGNDSDANANNSTYLGFSYANDTGCDRDKFFTGSRHFQVREIEVFQIIG